jgi:hypothetical protein
VVLATASEVPYISARWFGFLGSTGSLSRVPLKTSHGLHNEGTWTLGG